MKRKVFYNSKLAKMILFPGFSTCMFFGAVISKRSKLPESDINHEYIHVKQYIEVTVISAILALIVSVLLHSSGSSGWWIPLVCFPFVYYALYFGEALISFIHNFFAKRKKNASDAADKAYHNGMLEMEAFAHQDNPCYLDGRKSFTFLKYFGKI